MKSVTFLFLLLLLLWLDDGLNLLFLIDLFYNQSQFFLFFFTPPSFACSCRRYVPATRTPIAAAVAAVGPFDRNNEWDTRVPSYRT